MDSNFDFSNASIDDFKLSDDVETNTESSAEKAQTEVKTETNVQETVQQDNSLNTQTTESQLSEPTESVAKQEDREYKWKDDFIREAVEFYEKTGDLTPYLQAKTVDFNKMSDEEILRKSLREQYSDLTDKAFDRLYQKEVVDKYKLDADEYGEDDSELGRELLKAEASKVRNQYIEWQTKFKAPEQESDNSQIEDALKKFEEDVRNNLMTQNILQNKKISLKIGENEFNYEIPNADSLLNMTLDNDKFFSQFAGQEGNVDYARWYKTAAYSQNPELFEKALVNFGKTIGREEVTKELKNPSNNSVGSVPTESSGDFTTGLLQAFASRGISK
jgi:hypothetical protein